MVDHIYLVLLICIGCWLLRLFGVHIHLVGMLHLIIPALEGMLVQIMPWAILRMMRWWRMCVSVRMVRDEWWVAGDRDDGGRWWWWWWLTTIHTRVVKCTKIDQSGSCKGVNLALPAWTKGWRTCSAEWRSLPESTEATPGKPQILGKLSGTCVLRIWKADCCQIVLLRGSHLLPFYQYVCELQCCCDPVWHCCADISYRMVIL